MQASRRVPALLRTSGQDLTDCGEDLEIFSRLDPQHPDRRAALCEIEVPFSWVLVASPIEGHPEERQAGTEVGAELDRALPRASGEDQDVETSQHPHRSADGAAQGVEVDAVGIGCRRVSSLA